MGLSVAGFLYPEVTLGLWEDGVCPWPHAVKSMMMLVSRDVVRLFGDVEIFILCPNLFARKTMWLDPKITAAITAPAHLACLYTELSRKIGMLSQEC